MDWKCTIFFLLSFLCSTSYLQSQVIINEFSAANYDEDQDNYGEYEDWIELYNSSGSSVNIGGYYLSDRPDNLFKWEIPAGTSIPANGHLLFWCSSNNDTSPPFHTNFKITQTRNSEAIYLVNPIGAIVDSNAIDIPNQKNHSWGRTTDGAADWSVFTNPTPGSPNTNARPAYFATTDMVPTAGFFPTSTTVTINHPDPDAQIYYTTNGDEPNNTSTPYSAPITVNSTTALKAIAYSPDPNVPPSFIETNTYFIGVNHTLPVISITGDNINNLLDGATWAEPEGTFELFKNNNRVADATGEFNKHGNDSWAYPQRGLDYICRDQFGYDYAVKNQVFDSKDRTRFQRLILKPGANDNYPFETGGAYIRDAYVHQLSAMADMDMDERTYQPAVMYVNGQYWGLYEMREKVDDNDFTDYYYGHNRPNIDYIKTWGGTWAEYGSMSDWNTLQNYILTNDMSDPAAYAYVESQFNLLSLVDYMILNTHVVCMDWLSWNTSWWRGTDPNGDPHVNKWRYTLWDMDATFGHYINYTNIPNTDPVSDPCDNEDPGIDDPVGHTEMLTALLENDDFYALYINRYADMNNTYFTCDFMIGMLDSLVNRIAPEMPNQIARWGGNMAEWQENVDSLRSFILTRCTVIDSGIEDCYEVEGPFPVTVIVQPPGSGDVLVNTVVPLSYPYQSDYFNGVPINLTALPQPGGNFIGWQANYSAFNPNNTALSISIDSVITDTIYAFFVPGPGCSVSVNTSGTNANACSGLGSASVTAQGGTGNYSYLWSNNATTPNVNNLSAGTYFVTVYDGPDCFNLGQVTIEGEESFGLQLTTEDGLCSAFSGSASVFVDGTGTPPYSYYWETGQTTQTIYGLTSGTYAVTVTDDQGCTSVDSVNVVSNGQSPNIEFDVNHISCFGETDGFIQSVVSGGQGTYDYYWSNNVLNNTFIGNLSAGDYSLQVVDDNNCSSIASITIIEPDPIIPLMSSTPSNGGFNGSATTSPVGGVSPYSYLWENGETTSTITGLNSGTYIVTVTDVNGCTATNSVDIDEFATGLESLNNLNRFEAMPNPTSGAVLVALDFYQYEKGTLRIFDLLGESVLEFPVSGQHLEIPIDLNQFTNGLYLIQIQTKEGSAFLKLIKNK